MNYDILLNISYWFLSIGNVVQLEEHISSILILLGSTLVVGIALWSAKLIVGGLK